VRMGSRVTDLIIEEDGDGLVRGVRYHDDNGDHELRAQLTVAADGRSSRVRTLAGFEPRPNAAAMDVMWVVLPRKDDEQGVDLTGFRVGHGRLVVVLARATEWQLGYVILKGSRHTVKEAGLAALRTEVATLVPELADRVHTIDAWTDIHFLSVESSRIPTWHRPGVLAIGDAAHVMSPIAGVGINYAIQDAVAAANRLAEPLLAGTVSDTDLAAVQRRRELPTRFIQRFQAIVQRLIVARALDGRPFRLPLSARLVSSVPGLRNLPARIVGWGIRPERPRTQRAAARP
jgi:2-polyprenyl-6-methoxyphenol hydroxylase-like FAD-dependent oxidoreductase